MIKNQISLRQIYIEVFNLFKVKYWIDPNLSVKKLHAYYQNKTSTSNNNEQLNLLDGKSDGGESTSSELITYIECMTRAHNVFLNQFIFMGYKFQKMQENPLASQDSMHGQPQIWTMILDEIMEERDRDENMKIEQEL